MEYSFHRIANLYPMCTDEEMKEMEESIRKNGLVEPITLHIGMILDGRNRYLACKKVGVIPKFTVYQGDNPLEFVEAKNIHRRHLTTTQRAMIAARTLLMKQEQEGKLKKNQETQNCVSGSPFNSLPPLLPLPPSLSAEAVKQKVSERTATTAKTVLKEGLPPLVELVDEEKVSLSLASRVAKEPRVVQGEFISRVEKGEKPAEAYRSTVMHAGWSEARNEMVDTIMHKGYEDAKSPETRQVFCPYCNKGFKVPE